MRPRPVRMPSPSCASVIVTLLICVTRVGRAGGVVSARVVCDRVVCGCLLTAVLLVHFAARTGHSAESVLPGHSHQGQAFDRGPRHSAYLMGGTGKVHFPVTSKDPRVEKFVEQGIGQLHGFWFAEAERPSARRPASTPVAALPTGAWRWPTRPWIPAARDSLPTRRRRHKAGLSDREQMYLAALTDEAGYQKIAAKYPADLEAKAFEVWRLWNKRERGDESDALANQANGLIHAILRAEPMHPIHHAMIHFADSQNRVEGALDSAAKCGPSAPSIGHMWHMPAHIYYPLKDYARAAWQLEASIRTENRHAIQDWASPSHLYAHNNEWLIRTLLRLGSVHEARQIALSMIDLPRQPDLSAAPSVGESADETKTERLSEADATGANLRQRPPHSVAPRLRVLGRIGRVVPDGLLAADRLDDRTGSFPCERGHRGVLSRRRRGRRPRTGDAAERAGRKNRPAAGARLNQHETSSPSPKSSAVQAADSQLAVEISELRRQLEIPRSITRC